MATGPRYRVPMRRRHEIRTDYHQRLRLLRSDKPRLVVRVSNEHVRAQLVTPGPQGDETHAAATSADLDEYDWEAPTGNLLSAYLVGCLASRQALTASVEKMIPSIGLNAAMPGNKVFAVQEGAIGASLEIPHNDVVLADWDRNRDVHVAKHAEQLDEPLYSGEFDATSLSDHFDKVLGNLQEDE